MKKILVAAGIACILLASFGGALALLPHAHGDDFSHASHKACPVHQIAQSGVHADVAVVFTLAVSVIVSFFISAGRLKADAYAFRFSSSRAPPALL